MVEVGGSAVIGRYTIPSGAVAADCLGEQPGGDECGVAWRLQVGRGDAFGLQVLEMHRIDPAESHVNGAIAVASDGLWPAAGFDIDDGVQDLFGDAVILGGQGQALIKSQRKCAICGAQSKNTNIKIPHMFL